MADDVAAGLVKGVSLLCPGLAVGKVVASGVVPDFVVVSVCFFDGCSLLVVASSCPLGVDSHVAWPLS